VWRKKHGNTPQEHIMNKGTEATWRSRLGRSASSCSPGFVEVGDTELSGRTRTRPVSLAPGTIAKADGWPLLGPAVTAVLVSGPMAAHAPEFIGYLPALSVKSLRGRICIPLEPSPKTISNR
jgi:hypothetical protein